MKKIHFALAAVFLTTIAVITVFSGTAFSRPEKRLFIVHSYESNHLCGQPQHDGALKALEEAGWIAGKNYKLSVYYMDTKRKNNTAELIAQQAKLALKKIKNFRPDVILSLDDNAFETVALPLAGQQVQVIFSGMNGQPEDYNKRRAFMESRKKPGGNITGVYEKLHVREAIQVLSKLLKLKTVRVLEDLSPTGRAIARQVELELRHLQDKRPLPCAIERRTVKSWEDYKREIDIINKDPDIGAFYLGSLLLKDSSNHIYTTPDIIDYTIKNSQKPAIGINYAFIKMGLYGGASLDFFAMGHQAGEKVAAVLNGAKAGDLPIQDANRIALVFNLTRAKALGMTIPDDILLAADEIFSK